MYLRFGKNGIDTRKARIYAGLNKDAQSGRLLGTACRFCFLFFYDWNLSFYFGRIFYAKYTKYLPKIRHHTI